MAPKGFVPLIHLNPDCQSKPTAAYNKEMGATSSVDMDYTTKTPPWDTEGKRYRGRGWEENVHEELWNVAEMANCNLVAHIADFYLLDAIGIRAVKPPAGAPLYFPKFTGAILLDMVNDGFEIDDTDLTLQGISLRAILAQQRLAIKLSKPLRNYCHYALSRELRYHPAAWTIGAARKDIIASWWHMTEREGGGTTARWAYELFSQTRHNNGTFSVWSSSFGGPAWAQAAKVLRWYEERDCDGMPFAEREFCDRIFSLQHNSGSLLNKVAWKNGTSGLSLVLDAHHESGWSTLMGYASLPVRKLALEYWEAMQNAYDTMSPIPSKLGSLKDYPEWAFVIPPETVSFIYNDTEFCLDASCSGECGLPKWFMSDPKPILGEDGLYQPTKMPSYYKCGISQFPGKDVVTGEMFNEGEEIVWHGPGRGASTVAAWEARFGPVFKWHRRMTHNDDGGFAE